MTGDPTGGAATAYGQAQIAGIKDTIKNPSLSNIGTMAATGLGVGSAIVGGLGGLFGGGGGSKKVEGLQLPKELEFQYLLDSYKNLQYMQQDYQKLQAVQQTYQERFNIIDQQINGLIPSQEASKALASNTMNLVQSLGGDLEGAMKNGFLRQSDIEDLKSLKDLESQNFKDPVYDAQRTVERQKLQSQLARQGASPAEIQMKLASFDNESVLGAFSRSNELKQVQSGLISNRLQLQSGLRTETQNQGINAANAQLGALGQFANMAQARAGVATQGASAFFAGQQQGLANIQSQNQTYGQLGEFDFSKEIRKQISLGRTGFRSVNKDGQEVKATSGLGSRYGVRK